jgi:adhesin transport system membrane fusion protein
MLAAILRDAIRHPPDRTRADARYCENIQVTTIGGVIPPNGEMMEIVPLDDHLLIETRLSLRDIAFIHPASGRW